eukprot:m.272792 g.272792  ORF g.272792 m.272792 type:complete len:97 (+) comp103619_c0_seq1:418-708(+)
MDTDGNDDFGLYNTVQIQNISFVARFQYQNDDFPIRQRQGSNNDEPAPWMMKVTKFKCRIVTREDGVLIGNSSCGGIPLWSTVQDKGKSNYKRLTE